MNFNVGQLMRAMMLEFDDLGCEDCDRQYMLGSSILVAPVMSKEGTVDYYLPSGKWAHLLTGETVDGGSWHRDTYDFFSLPVFVRENTILPVGDCDDKTDYNYIEKLTLRIYNLADGAKASRTICDTDGNVVLKATATRNGATITVKLNGDSSSVKFEQIGTDCKISVIQ